MLKKSLLIGKSKLNGFQHPVGGFEGEVNGVYFQDGDSSVQIPFFREKGRFTINIHSY